MRHFKTLKSSASFLVNLKNMQGSKKVAFIIKLTVPERKFKLKQFTKKRTTTSINNGFFPCFIVFFLRNNSSIPWPRIKDYVIFDLILVPMTKRGAMRKREDQGKGE